MLGRMLRGCPFGAVQQSLGSRGQETQRAGGQGYSFIGQRPWLKACERRILREQGGVGTVRSGKV